MFPVNVEVGGVTYTQAKVWANDDRTEVWVVRGAGPEMIVAGPALIKQRRSMGEKFADGSKARWVLDLGEQTIGEDGTPISSVTESWLLAMGSGCGCSHPLKHFDPATAART